MAWKILIVGGGLVGATLVGCVSMGAHHKSLADLAESCRVASHSALAFERYKHDAESQIAALEQEQERLGRAYLVTKNELTRTQSELQSAQYHLGLERGGRGDAEKEVRTLLQQREVLASRVEDLEGRLEVKEEKLDRGTAVRAVGRARLELLTEDRERLESEWLVATTAAAQAQERLAAVQHALQIEQAGRQEADRALSRVQERSEQLERLEHEVRRERDALKTKLGDITARLGAARAALLESSEALHAAQERLAFLREEQTQTRAALSEAKSQSKRLRAALAAEREIWLGLQEALRKVERPPLPSAPE